MRYTAASVCCRMLSRSSCFMFPTLRAIADIRSCRAVTSASEQCSVEHERTCRACLRREHSSPSLGIFGQHTPSRPYRFGPAAIVHCTNQLLHRLLVGCWRGSMDRKKAIPAEWSRRRTRYDPPGLGEGIAAAQALTDELES